MIHYLHFIHCIITQWMQELCVPSECLVGRTVQGKNELITIINSNFQVSGNHCFNQGYKPDKYVLQRDSGTVRALFSKFILETNGKFQLPKYRWLRTNFPNSFSTASLYTSLWLAWKLNENNMKQSNWAEGGAQNRAGKKVAAKYDATPANALVE